MVRPHAVRVPDDQPSPRFVRSWPKAPRRKNKRALPYVSPPAAFPENNRPPALPARSRRETVACRVWRADRARGVCTHCPQDVDAHGKVAQRLVEEQEEEQFTWRDMTKPRVRPSLAPRIAALDQDSLRTLARGLLMLCEKLNDDEISRWRDAVHTDRSDVSTSPGLSPYRTAPAASRRTYRPYVQGLLDGHPSYRKFMAHHDGSPGPGPWTPVAQLRYESHDTSPRVAATPYASSSSSSLSYETSYESGGGRAGFAPPTPWMQQAPRGSGGSASAAHRPSPLGRSPNHLAMSSEGLAVAVPR